MRKKLLCIAIPLSAACATVGPSKELVDARQAYEDARTSPAAEYRPDAVHAARQALERAEQAHSEDPGSFREHSLAYVADREAQKAAAWGRYEQDIARMEQSETAYRDKQAQLLAEAEQEKRSTEAALNSTQSELEDRTDSLEQTRANLNDERKARLEAEKTAEAAIASLQSVARVKEESRGTVITLDGAVLFLTGKSELMPLAKRKLDDVAKALKETDPDQKIVVEGHTDSRGADADNMELSRQRAQAVRDYLVSQGVSQDRISSVGRGETQPIAKNETAEGRANNRRVEIIVQPASTAGTASTPSTPQPAAQR